MTLWTIARQEWIDPFKNYSFKDQSHKTVHLYDIVDNKNNNRHKAFSTPITKATLLRLVP
jgi:hypothetical protein